ncbi:YncE family protein [Mucilaginibacter hurinus]|uniref:YncE family protein n=1 Tax=Mucilaginibacter hurinus TaxID=2201324 RepID=A0A367GT95_9SPHI|nr:YncE family protein [Mucilaginibacter hurinus]RCH55923.1 YncE family protein [Mucilaginibacter hurinus]
MKQLQLRYLFIALALGASLASCRKDKNEPTDTFETPDVLILSQGNIGKNNSLVSSYNFTSNNLVTDAFSAVNGRGIGDTGNDIKQYGSKIYIVVNYSSTVEVIASRSLKSLKQVPLMNGATPRQPRSIAFYQNKAYVSSYDGTVAVIDTASLTVDKFINVGRNPEQLAVANGKLYVANSGGLDYPNVDNTVSVINLNTGTLVKTITVGDNPYGVAVDKGGDVYVSAYGVYYGPEDPLNTSASLAVINSATDEVKTKNDFFGSNFTISGNFGYYLNWDSTISVYDTDKEVVIKDNLISDGTTFKAAYNLTVADNGEFFVTDAKDYSSDGELFIFDSSGKKRHTLTTGINPSAVLIVKK